MQGVVPFPVNRTLRLGSGVARALSRMSGERQRGLVDRIERWLKDGVAAVGAAMCVKVEFCNHAEKTTYGAIVHDGITLLLKVSYAVVTIIHAIDSLSDNTARSLKPRILVSETHLGIGYRYNVMIGTFAGWVIFEWYGDFDGACPPLTQRIRVD